MDIELLVVPDCPNEAAAAELITTAVAETRVNATLTRTVISSLDQATQRGFGGSPTILLDGRDPFARPGEAGVLACRLYATPDGPQGVPALRDVCQALKRAATDAPRDNDTSDR